MMTRKEVKGKQKGTKFYKNKGTVITSLLMSTLALAPLSMINQTEVAHADTVATTSNFQQAFINLASGQAQSVASSNDLYASVMIAQAILESDWGRSGLSVSPNNNLFGIKGSYNGQSVTMKTQEFLNGKWVTIDAKFRKYPSYTESFQDNARLLKTTSFQRGVYFYSGAWKSNTNSYKDATAWLTGRYATAPNYATSLNGLIEKYNLTQYDTPSTGGSTSTDAGSNTGGSNVSTPNVNVEAMSATGKITASPNLIIRSTPSTSGANSGNYSYNQTVTITGKATGTSVSGNTTWYKTDKGFISSAYVAIQSTSATNKTGASNSGSTNTNTNTSTGTTATSQTGTVTASPNLIIRKTASTSGANVGTYNYNQSIKITGTTTGTSVNGNTTWYKTDKGFVSGAYVKLASTTTSSTPSTNTGSSSNTAVTDTKQTGTINTTLLIVRKSASTSASAVGTYTKGTKVTITGTTKGTSVNGNTTWYKTDKGFISGAYVTVSNSSTASNSKLVTTGGKTYVVKSGDSVWGISNKFGISMSDFVKWNNIKNNFIYPNQTVKISK